MYTINPSTGAASLVNLTTATLTAGSYGFDFNPVVDRIRVVGANGQNLRLDPRNGALAATDGATTYGVADVSFGAVPAIVASAYTNNFAGTTSTVLFNIDATTNVLVRQDPPNSGTLTTIGPLGIDATNQTAFDISQGGTPYLVIESTPGVSSSLYTVNLATGAATLVGPVGNASTGVIRSFAVVLPAPNAVRGWGMYE